MSKLVRLFDDTKAINGKIVTVQYVKVLQFKKDYPDMLGSLVKVTTATGLKIGVSNENATHNQEVREGNSPAYTPGALRGKVWIDYPVMMADLATGKKRYCKFENWLDLVNYDSYFEFKGKKVKSIEKYHPMLLAKEYKKYPRKNIGGTERAKVYHAIDLDNIVWIEFKGEKYYGV